MIALISDTHFGSKSFSKSIFESQMYFFENQFFPFIIKNKIKDVIHLGDLVHNRNTIDLWILQELKTRFFKWFEDNNIALHLLIGNHDSYYRSTIDYSFQKENLKEFKKCVIYNENKIIELDKYMIGMIPWIYDQSNFQSPKGVDILCGHFEMVGFPMMKNIFSHAGFDSSIFKDYKYVFSGHYHTKSIKNNIHYVGTQYQLSWNDYAEDKGFYVLKDNFQIEYIHNDVCPRFVKIFYNDVNDLEIKQTGLNSKQEITIDEAVEIAKHHYVRLYSEKCNDSLLFDNLHSSLSVVSKNDYKIEVVNLEEVIEDYDFSGIDDTDENTIDIIIKYIENMTFEESISASTLIEMSKTLYKEAIDESLCIGDNE